MGHSDFHIEDRSDLDQIGHKCYTLRGVTLIMKVTNGAL